MLEWIVSSQETGTKLLSFLVQHLEKHYSAKALKRAIDHNCCQINGRIERFSSTPLGRGDHISFQLPSQILSSHSSQAIEKERILYEDDILLVYNKPAGINSDEKGILALIRPYAKVHLVHRLDRETTGVLLLVKQARYLENLIQQFKQLQVQKTYRALVDGQMAKSQGMIENYLGKKGTYSGQTVWGSVAETKGLYAYTAWKCLKATKNASLVLCFPKTGRTHQIRVHMAESGHPILGDFQYCKRFQCPYQPSRYLLHAEEIRFKHPLTGQVLDLRAPLPDDFQQAYQQLFTK